MMIRLSSLCPAYLFSFRFVRLRKLALPPRDGCFELARHPGGGARPVRFPIACWRDSSPHIDVTAWRTANSASACRWRPRAGGAVGRSASAQRNYNRSDPGVGLVGQLESRTLPSWTPGE